MLRPSPNHGTLRLPNDDDAFWGVSGIKQFRFPQFLSCRLSHPKCMVYNANVFRLFRPFKMRYEMLRLCMQCTCMVKRRQRNPGRPFQRFAPANTRD